MHVSILLIYVVEIRVAFIFFELSSESHGSCGGIAQTGVSEDGVAVFLTKALGLELERFFALRCLPFKGLGGRSVPIFLLWKLFGAPWVHSVIVGTAVECLLVFAVEVVI